jgi:hypothetical protein
MFKIGQHYSGKYNDEGVRPSYRLNREDSKIKEETRVA